MMKRLYWVLLTAGVLALATACAQPAPTSTTPPVAYSVPELKYILFAKYDPFWCDPDFYPIGRPEYEEQQSVQQFPTIRANADEFAAILKALNLPDRPTYSGAEMLLIYRQHKKLTYAVQFTASGDEYNFVIRTGEGQGWRYEGTMTKSGKITVTVQEPSINACPICLTQGTLIDTPSGPVPVPNVTVGMAVWTQDAAGNRVPAAVIAVGSTPVPAGFAVVRVTLIDGRTITASPGHPTADGQPLGSLKPGDVLDGAAVFSVEAVADDGGRTFDLLPSGGTGRYWANGILLGSTLAR